MAASSLNQQLLFPPTDYKVQSPYLYLQAVGSTGVDGSTYGAHVRWQLLRNLGDSHLAKGDNATTTLNFNRPDDYLTLLRSRYVTRFPTIVDFSVAPNVVNDALAFWIYTTTVTNAVVYIHFRDAAKYALVRAAIDPLSQPLQFVQQYCPELIEAELKDKLFFAAEFDVARDAATVMRAEALSVEENVPLSPLFVSCRKVFTNDNWCGAPPLRPEPRSNLASPPGESQSTEVPACCDGPNLLENGGFEQLGTISSENFDGVVAPALPAGWVATNADGPRPLWVTSATNPDTPPNDAFAEAPAVISDKRLDRAPIEINSAAQIRFRNNYDFAFSGETFWEGGVLEVSINGGPCLDIIDPAVGGSFVSGGYNGEVDGTVDNPIGSQQAWVGNSGGYIDTVVNLGFNVVGQSIQLRFRMGTGKAGGELAGGETFEVESQRSEARRGPIAPGWHIDTFLIVGEDAPIELGFETDYIFQGGAKPGTVNVTEDASRINAQWVGLPHGGRRFLAVDGSESKGMAVLRFTRQVELQTDYCFTGWLSTLWQNDVSIPVQFRFTSADGAVQLFTQSTPATLRTWEEFTFTWNSGASPTVTVEIISLSTLSVGNDFGIDDLWFCQGGACRARIGSENLRSIRFAVNGGYPRRLEFETYDDYIAGALWDTLDRLALTTNPTEAFSRLEPAPNTVNGHWQKFNDNALLKVSNYQDRWTRAGGLGYGVQRYIALSDTDPMAIDTLLGDVQPQDGSIQISLFDALRIVSFDFHAARMLGQGYLDGNIAQDTEDYIYLGIYDTDGALDDTNIARPVRHYFMGVPTKPLDHRLPDPPTLKPVTYGITVDSGEPQQESLTDPQGYTPDGLSRYVNLLVEPEDDSEGLTPFFVPPTEFCFVDKTSTVFYGIEYRTQGAVAWRKPEIACDADYQDLDVPAQFETLPLPNNFDPAKPNRPILRHEEREDGVHEYGGYAINWFSRVSPVGNMVATDATLIKKAQRLLPPANLAVQLIQQEAPLMLTTQDEQLMLTDLPGPDRTLVRVTFDYYHVHDINYAFADTVELFFRSEMPRNVVGGVKSVIDDPTDSHRVIIRTTGYEVNSQGATIFPALAPALFGNFIGGMLSCQQENYVVTDISSSTELAEGPIFTVQKNARGNASDPGLTGAYVTVQEYTGPKLELTHGPLMFMAVENMAESNSWGTPNPLSKIINLGDSSWTPHNETYLQDGDTITVKLRGISETAKLAHTPTATASGVYQITFDTYELPHHPQHADADPVEWYKGSVRVATVGDPNGPKKVLEVLLVENIDANQPLVLHVLDNAYDPSDPDNWVITNALVTVNYYPGYKVYLHADPSRNFTEATILPAAGEGNRKTWLGARSRDTAQSYHSAVGIPAPIVALEFVEPLPPEQPQGGEFATWPDFYYKSSYTFKLDFASGHKPFSVVLYRANDEAILRTLYTNVTYNAVRQELELLGEDDPYRSDRWKNLLSFDYVYDDPARPYYDPTNSNTNGTFRKFPREDGYAFPHPDKGGALNGSAPGSIMDALKEAVWGAFTALTELPLVFDLIKGPSYEPVPKRQNIRNAQGTLLDPNDPAFDMAPMAKRTGTGFEIQFTDFTLDGTGVNIFFYCGREIGNRGRLGDPGAIAGPVRLINTRPPDQPGVKKLYVQELDLLEQTGPAVNFEINAYPDVQRVGRMLVYRATDAADALSVRAMQLVKTVDLAATNQAGAPSVLLSDDFENGFVPYGDPLFYRIVALRQIKKPGGGTDWAPSQPSKVLLTAVPDTINPEAPEITFTSNGLSGSPAVLTGVNLSWPTTVHNGTYYLDKMNAVGNWVTIYRSKTNTTPMTVNLAATDLGTDVLPKEDADEGRPIYNRFRVRAENSSGLFSLIDRVLVI